MPAYIIVDVDVVDAQCYEEYKQMVPASLEIYGGRFLVRGGKHEDLEAGFDCSRVVVLEFESVERAKAWYHSPEYRDALALRQATTRSRMLVAEGV